MNERSVPESRGHQTIGGPLLWLGLACALGNGLCSQPVVDGLLSRLHLKTLEDGEPELREVISSLVIMAAAGVLFFLIRLLVSRLCRGHAELPRWRRLILLSYVCSLSWQILIAVVSVFFRFDQSLPETMMLVVFVFSSFGIGAFLFAMKNPPDGFFCEGISLLMMEQYSPHVTGIRAESAYFSGVTMGLIFAYIYGHAWSQRLLGLLAMVPVALCLYQVRNDDLILVGVVLLYGAVPGSIVWVIRWGLRRRKLNLTPNPLPAPRHGSGQALQGGGAEEPGAEADSGNARMPPNEFGA
jgi:hypothetical protein